ncbi:DUF1838 family protein [Yinghuangia seranimata]|uniref:DUF1838 family protein n=1 Tax=Yinghuangia seranimata TaxID=408067 RepID=UPI00248C1ED3|nr:DUF1838 family protein [Yinghuangia seranimata]MDI2130405.1 DUF1838 family protein [Yinghuangia seranimata]
MPHASEHRPDLRDPADNLESFVRARASLGPEDTVVWWTGHVHTQAPGENHRTLFRFEGFNVGRTVAVDGGHRFLAREAAFYQDPATGEILDSWANPFTGEDVEVLHIWNDPVNMELLLDGPRGPWRAPVTELGDDVMWAQDILLAYPSPLPVAKFPENSADDVYRAMELFQFFCRRSDLDRPDLPSVPCHFSWARLSPWLPWMRMGARPGGLVFHCHGKKLGGYDELPERLRAYVAEHEPHFASAPKEWSVPNVTSWSYFRDRNCGGIGQMPPS